ncbi:helix-turn-helix domain-containing protein [Actinoplanes sp. NEAU-A12]|uniref:Helix-turn-helix domain-containing protein n=1 Tax=Actinoplanes sandaracinus TaxID=3045177 RepID=A0ABT6WHK6_9ACTN|nr:helix-turn-helix domain-containing protein [Actinoplanes sandaracinus]MDI6099212.1 helix-turn-helix domain-containing protein [Actinoplanes sandaracinus]
MLVRLAAWVELTADQDAELRALTTSSEVSAAVGTRARIVLWHAEGRMKKDIAVLAGVSRPTVDLWLRRYAADGAAGLFAAKQVRDVRRGLALGGHRQREEEPARHPIRTDKLHGQRSKTRH